MTGPSILCGVVMVSPLSSLQLAPKALAGPSNRIDVNTARTLREVIFGGKGSELWEFGDNWRQPLHFTSVETLGYGLWQEQGGPCGLLATIQAYLMKHLLHEMKPPCDLNDATNVKQHRRTALAAALAEILWVAGGRKSCVVCLYVPEDADQLRGQNIRTSVYRPDNFTELLTMWRFNSHESVREFLGHNMHMLEHAAHAGAVSFFYSVVLSKGVELIAQEMDNTECTLVGKFGYCTMEAINLMLVGQAKSNVFDGDKDLSEGTDIMILGGVNQKSDIGLLTLFEVYGSLEVGSNLKSPTLPIWIICSESHFSLLFSAAGYPNEYRPFDLMYYDELARQEGPIRLSVDPTAGQVKEIESDPPLELVLATKWASCSVDWNGAEKIL